MPALPEAQVRFLRLFLDRLAGVQQFVSRNAKDLSQADDLVISDNAQIQFNFADGLLVDIDAHGLKAGSKGFLRDIEPFPFYFYLLGDDIFMIIIQNFFQDRISYMNETLS